MSQPKVRFWFDPGCPWTWITYTWLKEVQQLRGLEVDLRLLSLTMLNEGRGDEKHVETHRQGLRLERVMAAAAASQTEPSEAGRVLGDLYAAAGTIIHVGGRDLGQFGDVVIAEALEASLLPEDLAQAADDEGWDPVVRAQTEEGLALVGRDVGVPIIAVDEVAFFGPVLSPAPHGEAAARAWDGCLALASTPGFYELKRSRDVGPQTEGLVAAPACPI